MRSLRPLLVTAMLLAGACAPDVAPVPVAPAAPATAPDANPGAAPGLVRWHESVAAARSAAAASGKPVLVFQLLGRLDDEFC